MLRCHYASTAGHASLRRATGHAIPRLRVLSGTVDTTPTEGSRVDDRLREATGPGRCQPNGRLIANNLAHTLGVSRTVIRAALSRLEHEGLVEHERHRGARVRLIGLGEVVGIIEVRAVLEGWRRGWRPSGPHGPRWSACR